MLVKHLKPGANENELESIGVAGVQTLSSRLTANCILIDFHKTSSTSNIFKNFEAESSSAVARIF